MWDDNFTLKRIYTALLSHKAKERFEHLIIFLSMACFVLHLIVLLINHRGGVQLTEALYTPFTIILIYEVYLLVYYLRRSIIEYIGKQYEIVSLILIRSVFEDFAHHSFSFQPLTDAGIAFIVKIVGISLLFYLVRLFYRIASMLRRKQPVAHGHKGEARQFLTIKKTVSVLLIFIFIGLLLFSVAHAFMTVSTMESSFMVLKKMNHVFYDSFFTTLILSEVFLLLLTMIYTDDFSIIMRDSAFIISTTLMKIAFGEEPLAFTGIIVVSVAFGVAMLAIYRLYEQPCDPKKIS
jgi:hypothetical protein